MYDCVLDLRDYTVGVILGVFLAKFFHSSESMGGYVTAVKIMTAHKQWIV